MAQRAKAFPEQAAGAFFVDRSCIDCGTYYAFAPGTYRDAGLQVPHGAFAYHHPNGRLESSGTYVDGRKHGVWLRFDAVGRALAERCYGVTEPEALLVAHGWASRAAWVDGASAAK